MSSRHATLGIALALLVLTAALRFRGLDYLLPLVVEPDAHIAVQVGLIEEGAPDLHLNRNYGSYPHLVAWTTMLLSDPLPEGEPESGGASLEAQLEAAKRSVLRVREAVALLSILILPATWLVARAYLSSGWSLVAATLAATSLLAVHFGAQARPHGAAVGLTTLALWCCIRVRRRGDLAAYVLASIVAGLALGCLQSGIALGFPFLAAHLLAARGQPWKRHLRLLVPLAGLALAVLAFYPFLLAGGDSVATGAGLEQSRLTQGGHTVMLRKFNGRGFPLLLSALWSWEPALFAGSLAALAGWGWDRLRRAGRWTQVEWGDHLVVLAYVVPYALVIGLYQRSYERFLLPLIPLVAIFVTAWVRRVASVPGPAAWRSVAYAGVFLVVPCAIAWRLTEVRQAPSTIEEAGAWVEEHVRPGERVLLTSPIVLPLYKTLASDAADKRGRSKRGMGSLGWFGYQVWVLAEARGEPRYELTWMPLDGGALLEDMAARPEEYVDALSGEYVVAEVFEGRIHPALGRVHAVMSERFESQTRLTPDRSDGVSELPIIYQDATHAVLPHFAWRVLQARAMGPVIEIFKVPAREGS